MVRRAVRMQTRSIGADILPYDVFNGDVGSMSRGGRKQATSELVERIGQSQRSCVGLSRPAKT